MIYVWNLVKNSLLQLKDNFSYELHSIEGNWRAYKVWSSFVHHRSVERQYIPLAVYTNL